MKTFLYHFSIFTLILCSANSYGQLKDSTSVDVRIEQKKDFYLKHLEKCWDVVEAMDTTVQRQKKIISELHRALKKSQIETGISNRMTISFRDSLTNQKLATEKQKSKKIFNRKWAIVSDALLICETIYIYTRQTLFKW